MIPGPNDASRKRRRLALGAVLAVLLLAAGIAVEWGVRHPPGTAPVRAAAAAPRFTVELRSDRLLPLATAVRDGDLPAAGREIAALAAADRALIGDPDTLLGLAAAAAGDRATARALLRRAPDRGPLADWRSLTLAELAAGDGDPAAALHRYSEVLTAGPTSPLRAGAALAAARLHRELGETFQALDLVELIRRGDGARGELRVDAEVLAWQIGEALGDDAVRREAGRRLLTLAPWRAAELGVAELFARRHGGIDWRTVLTPAELERRAATFLALGQPDAARLTLDDVAPAARRLSWHLLVAEALTDLHRGREALAALAVPPIHGSEERARVEYRRALAALDLAERRGGGAAASASERRWMRNAARHQLERAAELSRDPDLAAAALRHLYAALERGDADHRRRVLVALRRLDPGDRSGAAPLWNEGWSAHRRGDDDAAMAAWLELADLYPGSREAHRGLYWTARTLDKAGRDGDARRVYERLVESSDTTDFYRRQALVRLGSTPWLVGTRAEEVAELQPWDVDPLLARAKLLTDLGLDRLARREVAALGERAAPRDAAAVEALALSRGGQRRRAMILLHRAYPELGGPSQGEIPTAILRAYYPLAFADEIRDGARRSGLPPYLVAGIIRQESGFDPHATSRVGARGLMQLMPFTAREVAARLGRPYHPNDLYQPRTSILLGSAYFRRLLESFDGNVELALAAYNGGPNRIRRLWRERREGTGVDDFVETLALGESRAFVKRILVLADSYRRLYPEQEAVDPMPAAG